MAWDPNASPWNWDTGAVLLQSQGGEVWKQVESTSTIAAAGDGQFFVQHGGPHNGISSSMGSTFSYMHGAVVSDTGGGETVFPSLEPSPLPVVTDSIGWNDAYQGQDPGNVVQKRVSDNRERADDSHAGLLELKSHDYKQQQAVTNSKETVDNLIQTKHYEDKSSTEQQGRPLIHAGKTAKDIKDETGAAQLTEEQQNSMATGSAGSGESLIGLHLGKRAYFQDATAATGTKATQKPNPAPKRSRAAGMQTPCCQVEGCKTDLTSAKDYHRRHKVCEPHSKAGKVTVAKQEQRFCQQCSRFHLLAEFDEAKRSCRRRLAGHNERRRKPQPDPLALHARLQFSYQGWPFLQHPRFLGTPSLWQNTFDCRSTGTWPRTTRFEDGPIYDRMVQAPSMERQFHSKGLSHHTDDTLPLFLLQSPKEMMPIDLSHTNEKFSLHEYLSGSVGPVNNGLTLASSSPGAGVLSGLEATPATELVTRVTDSGCALSLLSPQAGGSYDAPDVVSLDLLGRTSIAIDQLMNEDNAPQQLLQRQQQHGYGYSTEKLLSAAMVPNSQDHSSACSLPAGWMVSVDKNHFEGSIMHGLNGDCSLEGHPLLAEFQGHHTRGPEDVKQTIDLMRISSQPQHGTPEEQSMSFHLGGCAFGDLQYTYESAF